MHETLTKCKDERTTQIKCSITQNVSGHVRIENGDTVIEGKNKITKLGILDLINYISSQSHGNDNVTKNRYPSHPGYQWVYLGTDTTTPTTKSTTALTAPIGSPTKNIGTISYATTPTGGYAASWAFTFNPNTVTGTVGEIGLYLPVRANSLYAALGSYGWDNYLMWSRFAVADGEFDAFTIDTTKPIIITWTLLFQADTNLTDRAAMTLANWCSQTDDEGNRWGPSVNFNSAPTGAYSRMVLGTDTETSNTPSMTALTAPIGTAPGTAASSQAIGTYQIDEGHYKISYVANWRPGSISGTVGEIGLYLMASATWSGVSGSLAPGGPYLWARRCVADEHFEAFEIDTSKNLTIVWEMHFNFET